ncbi:phosphoribosylanthranilate isomerase [Pontibacter qinzhouensis]|uniref:N-(5'-phosphoribosyl)anthranilate isomerase n=1 Tax=Pontibacter qinzhouensis TaxID=2603253 RepID=A0A5C8KEP3_9BACT|nr:phosphoribosylanthranilate isomerase [Pontibacter qinzhouensis]TXK51916.1 phosphoribosylanthranilate isomerase [Pontibacter qinzhouensis]
MLVKVCGMREPENVQQIAAFHPAFMGFIFYPGSRRFAGKAADLAFLKQLPDNIKRVGVFVNEQELEMKRLVKDLELDLVQLHGHEAPELCAAMQAAGVEVIKAFSVDDSFNFSELNAYTNCTDYFLFDTKGKEYGGNGITFDWQVLENYHLHKPYLLSGGLNLENIANISSISRKPFALDINSGFETKPGLKDVEKVKILFEKLIR